MDKLKEQNLRKYADGLYVIGVRLHKKRDYVAQIRTFSEAQLIYKLLRDKEKIDTISIELQLSIYYSKFSDDVVEELKKEACDNYKRVLGERESNKFQLDEETSKEMDVFFASLNRFTPKHSEKEIKCYADFSAKEGRKFLRKTFFEEAIICFNTSLTLYNYIENFELMEKTSDELKTIKFIYEQDSENLVVNGLDENRKKGIVVALNYIGLDKIVLGEKSSGWVIDEFWKSL